MLVEQDRLTITSVLNPGPDAIDTPNLMLEDHNGEVYHAMLVRVSQPGVPPPTIETAPAVTPAAQGPIVHVNDTIKLQAKNVNAEEHLKNFGVWWKVGPQAMAKQDVITKQRSCLYWILSSVSKQPRKLGSKVYQQITIQQVNDPNYEITGVCPFPRVFDYKEQKDT